MTTVRGLIHRTIHNGPLTKFLNSLLRIVFYAREDWITMEAGWVREENPNPYSPFTTMATRLFVYSTPDNYDYSCKYKGLRSDYCDHWGGFVEYPNTGYHIGVSGYDSVSLKFSVDYHAKNTSATFSLTSFVLDDDGNPSFNETIPIGHYSSSHYCHGISKMDKLQVGLEVQTNQTTSPGFQTAAGTIYGWGSGDTPYPIRNQFTSKPRQSAWTIEYPTPNDHVTFSGTQKNLACIWNTKKMCCSDPPEGASCGGSYPNTPVCNSTVSQLLCERE